MKRLRKSRFLRSQLSIFFVLVIMLGLVFPLLHSPMARAATGFIDPNGDGTIGANWVATPSGTFYTTVADMVRQPTTPNTSNNMSISNNRSDNAFLQMSTIAGVSAVTQVQIWIYHNDGSNGTVNVALYDNAETVPHATEQSFTSRATNSWDSVTINTALTQGQLDGLRFRFNVSKGAGSPSNVSIYAVYAVVTYSTSLLSTDIVDSGGNSVTSPSASLSSINSSFSCQTSTGTLGTASQKIRTTNTTANGNWTLTIAATAGPTASWSNGTNNFDFNDSSGSPAGCGDGGDSDSFAGQMSLNPSVGTITPQSGCAGTGISKGTASSFAQGTLDNLNLLTASGSQVNCYFDFIGISVSQTIPAEAPSAGIAYNINLTLTVTAN